MVYKKTTLRLEAEAAAAAGRAALVTASAAAVAGKRPSSSRPDLSALLESDEIDGDLPAADVLDFPVQGRADSSSVHRFDPSHSAALPPDSAAEPYDQRPASARKKATSVATSENVAAHIES